MIDPSDLRAPLQRLDADIMRLEHDLAWLRRLVTYWCNRMRLADDPRSRA